MDFRETIVKTKTFKFADLLGDKKDKSTITLANLTTVPEYWDLLKRQKQDAQSTEEEKHEQRLDCIAKYVITDWEKIKYKKKNVPFSVKNAREMLKNDAFTNIVLAWSSNPNNFASEIDLSFDFGEVSGN